MSLEKLKTNIRGIVECDDISSVKISRKAQVKELTNAGRIWTNIKIYLFRERTPGRRTFSSALSRCINLIEREGIQSINSPEQTSNLEACQNWKNVIEKLQKYIEEHEYDESSTIHAKMSQLKSKLVHEVCEDSLSSLKNSLGILQEIAPEELIAELNKKLKEFKNKNSYDYNDWTNLATFHKILDKLTEEDIEELKEKLNGIEKLVAKYVKDNFEDSEPKLIKAIFKKFPKTKRAVVNRYIAELKKERNCRAFEKVHSMMRYMNDSQKEQFNSLTFDLVVEQKLEVISSDKYAKYLVAYLKEMGPSKKQAKQINALHVIVTKKISNVQANLNSLKGEEFKQLNKQLNKVLQELKKLEQAISEYVQDMARIKKGKLKSPDIDSSISELEDERSSEAFKKIHALIQIQKMDKSQKEKFNSLVFDLFMEQKLDEIPLDTYAKYIINHLEKGLSEEQEEQLEAFCEKIFWLDKSASPPEFKILPEFQDKVRLGGISLIYRHLLKYEEVQNFFINKLRSDEGEFLYPILEEMILDDNSKFLNKLNFNPILNNFDEKLQLEIKLKFYILKATLIGIASLSWSEGNKLGNLQTAIGDLEGEEFNSLKNELTKFTSEIVDQIISKGQIDLNIPRTVINFFIDSCFEEFKKQRSYPLFLKVSALSSQYPWFNQSEQFNSLVFDLFMEQEFDNVSLNEYAKYIILHLVKGKLSEEQKNQIGAFCEKVFPPPEFKMSEEWFKIKSEKQIHGCLFKHQEARDFVHQILLDKAELGSLELLENALPNLDKTNKRDFILKIIKDINSRLNSQESDLDKDLRDHYLQILAKIFIKSGYELYPGYGDELYSGYIVIGYNEFPVEMPPKDFKEMMSYVDLPTSTFPILVNIEEWSCIDHENLKVLIEKWPDFRFVIRNETLFDRLGDIEIRHRGKSSFKMNSTILSRFFPEYQSLGTKEGISLEIKEEGSSPSTIIDFSSVEDMEMFHNLCIDSLAGEFPDLAKCKMRLNYFQKWSEELGTRLLKKMEDLAARGKEFNLIELSTEELINYLQRDQEDLFKKQITKQLQKKVESNFRRENRESQSQEVEAKPEVSAQLEENTQANQVPSLQQIIRKKVEEQFVVTLYLGQWTWEEDFSITKKNLKALRIYPNLANLIIKFDDRKLSWEDLAKNIGKLESLKELTILKSDMKKWENFEENLEVLRNQFPHIKIQADEFDEYYYKRSRGD